MSPGQLCWNSAILSFVFALGLLLGRVLHRPGDARPIDHSNLRSITNEFSEFAEKKQLRLQSDASSLFNAAKLSRHTTQAAIDVLRHTLQDRQQLERELTDMKQGCHCGTTQEAMEKRLVELSRGNQQLQLLIANTSEQEHRVEEADSVRIVHLVSQLGDVMAAKQLLQRNVSVLQEENNRLRRVIESSSGAGAEATACEEMQQLTLDLASKVLSGALTPRQAMDNLDRKWHYSQGFATLMIQLDSILGETRTLEQSNSEHMKQVASLEGQMKAWDLGWSGNVGTALPYAFVTMAYDESGTWDYMWAVLPLARALQQHSSYPLIVLTNSTTLPDGKTSLAKAMLKLNVQVLPLYRISLKVGMNDETYPQWAAALWKLQIWTLTQFKKVMWLDSDSLVSRSLDWIFDLDGMWAQRDDWLCLLNQPDVCSGILLAYPNSDDFVGLLKHAKTKTVWEHGDQQLISSYFTNVKQEPVQLLSDSDATFGQCLGAVPVRYVGADGKPVPGQWDTPAFVHKSGGWGGTNDDFSNICFSHIVWRQYYELGDGTTVNACHLHPMGPHWRSLFCEAARRLDVRVPEAQAFCDDGCWFKGKALSQEFVGKVDMDRWCRPVTASIPDRAGRGIQPFAAP